MKVSVAKEKGKNERYPYYPFEDSKQEVKKKIFSKGKCCFYKRETCFSKGKSMNDPTKRKMPHRFVISPLVSPGK